MPLFRQEPRPITYLFSSDNFRQTTITNAQTNETYWIEKYPESLLLWKSPSAKNGSLPMILVATIGLHTAWPGLQHVTYNGERKGMLSMFPSKYWEDRRTRIIPTPLGNYEWNKEFKLLDPNGQQVGQYKTHHHLFKGSPTGTLKLATRASNVNVDMVILAWMAMKYDEEEWEHILKRMKTHPM